jgi:hypothetical protein
LSNQEYSMYSDRKKDSAVKTTMTITTLYKYAQRSNEGNVEKDDDERRW